MPVATIAGAEVQVDEEGFMTEYDEWTEDLGRELAGNIGIEMTDDHWAVIRFLRSDYTDQQETATLRRVTKVGGIPTKQLFQLFPCSPTSGLTRSSGPEPPAFSDLQNVQCCPPSLERSSEVSRRFALIVSEGRTVSGPRSSSGQQSGLPVLGDGGHLALQQGYECVQ